MKLFYPLILSAIAVFPAWSGNLKIDFPVVHDWWWNAPEVPTLTVNVTDTVGNQSPATVKLVLTPDVPGMTPQISMSQQVLTRKGETKNLVFSFPELTPGFYRCTVSDDGNPGKSFWIGYEPQNVVSLPDSQPDFDEFWAKAIDELAQIPAAYTMTVIPEKSGKKRKTYEVHVPSVAGDTIKGYATIPVKKGKYPVHIYYNGYGVDPWNVDADARPDWIEVIMWTRGQGLDESTNKYGDWIQSGLESPDTYYYRNAFMDCLRTLDFVEQLPQADTGRIYAEGGSQGGAFTLAAASLDPKKRLRAIAPYVPFLSDYPDYFELVEWPGISVKGKAAQIGMPPAEMYRTMSYFDLKNLARRITAPVLMGVGLQDPTCPPHTNFSSFNLINSEKDFIIYPECGHTVVYDDWNPRREAFFNAHR